MRWQSYTVITRSPEETEELGRQFARLSSAGDMVSLLGELGSGKTTFVRGFVEGLEGDKEQVHSPSFTIYTVYQSAKGELYHVDFYRLYEVDEAIVREILEAQEEGARVIVEWAERCDEIVKNSRYVIKFTVSGERKRKIEVSMGD